MFAVACVHVCCRMFWPGSAEQSCEMDISNDYSASMRLS
jgi:hypothetical protein